MLSKVSWTNIIEQLCNNSRIINKTTELRQSQNHHLTDSYVLEFQRTYRRNLLIYVRRALAVNIFTRQTSRIIRVNNSEVKTNSSIPHLILVAIQKKKITGASL